MDFFATLRSSKRVYIPGTHEIEAVNSGFRDTNFLPFSVTGTRVPWKEEKALDDETASGPEESD